MLAKIVTFIVAVLIVILLIKVVAWAAALLGIAGLGEILKFVIIIGFVIWVLRWATRGFPDVI